MTARGQLHTQFKETNGDPMNKGWGRGKLGGWEGSTTLVGLSNDNLVIMRG